MKDEQFEFEAKPKTTCERQNCKAVMAVVVLFGIMVGLVLAQTDDLLATEIPEETSEEESAQEEVDKEANGDERSVESTISEELKREPNTEKHPLQDTPEKTSTTQKPKKAKARVMSIEELAALTEGKDSGRNIQTSGYAMPSSVRPGMVRVWDRDWRTWIVCQANQTSPLPENWNEDTVIQAQGVLNWGEDGIPQLDACIVNAS